MMDNTRTKRLRRAQIELIRAADVVDALKPHTKELRMAYDEAITNLACAADVYHSISTELDEDDTQ